MTTIAVPVVPPAIRAARSDLAASERWSEKDLADLFHAMSADTLTAVQESGGDLVLTVTEDHAQSSGHEPVETAQDLRDDVLEEETEAPILQISQEGGETVTGATLRALDQQSEAASVAVLDPRAPLVERKHLDAAAMRLRREDIAIGPTAHGGWYFLGISSSLDTIPQDLTRELAQVATIAREGEAEFGLLSVLPCVETIADLEGVAAMLMANGLSGRTVAPFTQGWIDHVGL